MDKYLGNTPQLKRIVEGKMGEVGQWLDLGTHIRFEARSGVIMIGWFKKRTLQFQGPAKKAADFRTRFIDAAGDLYQHVYATRGFFPVT